MAYRDSHLPSLYLLDAWERGRTGKAEGTLHDPPRSMARNGPEGEAPQQRRSCLKPGRPHLAAPLGGDALAAEYVLATLVSRVHSRTAALALGKHGTTLLGAPEGGARRSQGPHFRSTPFCRQGKSLRILSYPILHSSVAPLDNAAPPMRQRFHAPIDPRV